MTGEVSQVCVMTIPVEFWPNARKALRMLRELHRDAGGTSRLVRQGERTTLTAAGPAPAVLEAVANAQKIQTMINQSHSQKVADILDGLVRRRRAQRRVTFAQLLEQAIQDAHGGKVP
jgi:hypothetical protein